VFEGGGVAAGDAEDPALKLMYRSELKQRGVACCTRRGSRIYTHV
jgi:hypothetical protein